MTNQEIYVEKLASEYADSKVEHKFDETEWLQINDAFIDGYNKMKADVIERAFEFMMQHVNLIGSEMEVHMKFKKFMSEI